MTKTMTKAELRRTIGENIRNLRVSKGTSMDDLASELDKSTSFIGLIERGERGTTAHNLFRLSEIFKVDIGAFFVNHDDDDGKANETGTASDKKRNKISSLLSDLDEFELDFIISLVKGYKKLKVIRTESLKESETDDDDSDNSDDVKE